MVDEVFLWVGRVWRADTESVAGVPHFVNRRAANDEEHSSVRERAVNFVLDTEKLRTEVQPGEAASGMKTSTHALNNSHVLEGEQLARFKFRRLFGINPIMEVMHGAFHHAHHTGWD